MSTKFYKYVYGRQNYNRYNRDIMITNECTLKSQQQLIELREWQELEQLHRENPEEYPPPPPIPSLLEQQSENALPIDQLLCKQAYSRVVKKQATNPNSNIMSSNMRIGYWINHQHRVPLITAYY